MPYPHRGVDYVRGSLNWGPFPWLNGVSKTFGWWTNRRKTFADDFHTFVLEGNAEFMVIYVDSRLQAMMNLQITGKSGKDFFKRGHYPATATNGSSVAVVIEDIWQQQGGTPAAPFDQREYLFIFEFAPLRNWS